MEKTALRIRIFGDTVLRKKAKPVKNITQYHRDILEGMVKLMHSASGIGLAAPQVGISESLAVADIGSRLYKLINPKIVHRQGAQILEEGCLSVPGVCVQVKRSKKVLIEAQDEFGKAVTIEAQDLLACVFQHEIDHLKGRLIVDYARLWEKLRMKKKLAELKKRIRYEKLLDAETKSCKLQL